MRAIRSTPFFSYAIAVTAGSFLLFIATFASGANVQDEIADRRKQIEELQRQIEVYQSQSEAVRGQSRTLENEIKGLNAQIGEINLQIRSLELSINQTESEIQSTEAQITEAEGKISKHKRAMGQFLKIAYENDQRSLTEIILNHDNLSDFFTELDYNRINHENLQESIVAIKGLKSNLENYQLDLEAKQDEFEDLRRLEEIEKRSLDRNKSAKNKILKDTKGQESKFQELIKKSQQDIEAIRSQITYLEMNGVTAEDAVKFGQLAALRTGIRPEYLIAVLEVESGLGRNVGRCNRESDPPEKHWSKIMHTRDHEPFKTITSELGLNIENTPVSCPQYVNGKRYGWGGAMGPAQFIPSTWMGYKEEVAKLTGHNPANPWSIEDAFVAAAVKLARGGAAKQTSASEIAASKAYYSGNSKCSSSPCNSYANAIQRKAAEIAKSL